jgi:hypothetical protein
MISLRRHLFGSSETRRLPAGGPQRRPDGGYMPPTVPPKAPNLRSHNLGTAPSRPARSQETLAPLPAECGQIAGGYCKQSRSGDRVSPSCTTCHLTVCRQSQIRAIPLTVAHSSPRGPGLPPQPISWISSFVERWRPAARSLARTSLTKFITSPLHPVVFSCTARRWLPLQQSLLDAICMIQIV